jgi:hypothetical protein
VFDTITVECTPGSPRASAAAIVAACEAEGLNVRCTSDKAVGISFDDSWDGLIGVRIETTSRFNGPDIVAVGSGAAVPTPGSLAVMGLGVLAAGRRKR